MTDCEYCGKPIHLYGKYGWAAEGSVHHECYKKKIRDMEKQQEFKYLEKIKILGWKAVTRFSNRIMR